MFITYDPAKRIDTMVRRALDMKDVDQVFSGPCMTFEDTRQDYGEVRLITIGFLGGRMVWVAWTERDETRRIISLRKANDL